MGQVTAKLYLLPVTLGGDNFREQIPDSVIGITRCLRHFIVEDIRSARRYLRMIDREFPIDETAFFVLNEHTTQAEAERMLNDIIGTFDTGVMSEAGLPGIADPGSVAVRIAHRKGVRVIPFAGPSSILLSLIASGLNGQSFRFRGYLPVRQHEREPVFREIEREAKTGITQIFMETPYRSAQLAEAVVKYFPAELQLCIATNISLGDESIRTMTVAQWRKERLPEGKPLAVFLIGR